MSSLLAFQTLCTSQTSDTLHNSAPPKDWQNAGPDLIPDTNDCLGSHSTLLLVQLHLESSEIHSPEGRIIDLYSTVWHNQHLAAAGNSLRPDLHHTAALLLDSMNSS